MNDISIIKHPSLESDGGKATPFLGKLFFMEKRAPVHRIIQHQDYPMVHDADLEAFVAAARKTDKILISGGVARVHPYRLMTVNSEGYEGFCMDVPQSIRGQRQKYPPVYSFVPALISIPAMMNAPGEDGLEGVHMHLLSPEKLLDRAVLLDRLRILALMKKVKKI